MNFQTEIETLIRARYPILYIISSEEMRVQKLVVEIAAKRQKKVFEWSYSTGIVPAGTSIQSQKNRNAGHQGSAGRAGPGDRAGRAGDFPLQGFPSVSDEEQFRRHPQAQGDRAAPEEQLQDDHADFAGDGNSRRNSKRKSRC